MVHGSRSKELISWKNFRCVVCKVEHEQGTTLVCFRNDNRDRDANDRLLWDLVCGGCEGKYVSPPPPAEKINAAQRATLELIRNPSGAKEEEVADSDSDDDRPLAEQVARLQQQEQPPAKRAKSDATPAAAAAPAAVRAASAPAAAAQAPAASTMAAEPAAAPEPAAAKEDEEEAEVERPPVPLTFAELRDGLSGKLYCLIICV